MNIIDIIVFLLGAFITAVLLQMVSTYIRALRKYGIIELVATKTHNDRTLKFKKGNRYLFYKNGDSLLLNQDDSGPRDNFSFFKRSVLESFEPTDFYGRCVLEHIRLDPR